MNVLIEYWEANASRPIDCHPDSFSTVEEAMCEADAFMKRIPWATGWTLKVYPDDDDDNLWFRLDFPIA